MAKFGNFGKKPAAEPEKPAPAAGKFARKAPAVGASKPAAASAKKPSRWAKVPSEQGKDPYIQPGDYVVELTNASLGYNEGKDRETAKLAITVLQAEEGALQKEGDACFVGFMITGKGKKIGMGRTKAAVVAFSGCEDDDAYDEVDPEGELITSVLDGSGALDGRRAYLCVTKGNAIINAETNQPTGEYYGNYSWSPLEEEHQETASPFAEAE